MSHLKIIVSLVAASLAVTAGAQTPIAQAHYLTFDSVTPPLVLGQGDSYTPASPERFEYLADQIISFNPPAGGHDGAEIVAASAEAMQGGNMLETDPGITNDEGLWVEMTDTFPLGDITVEAIFMTRDINPPDRIVNTGLQYIVATEVPAGGSYFQGQLRILGDGTPVGRPGDSGKLEWNAGLPDGSGEVRVVSTSTLTADTWYHVVGTMDYNDSDPANSTMALYLAAGGIATAGDLQGTVTINLDHIATNAAWAVPFTPTDDVVHNPNTLQKPRYFIAAGPNNAINGADRRGLLGAVDAVCVTGQVGEIYLPDAPPIPPITGAQDWSIYR